MKLAKRLWLIFGPILIAMLGVVVLLFWPGNYGQSRQDNVEKAAVSLSPNVFKGNLLKSAAFDQDYVPFIGSSELSRMDPFHPSVLATKYRRNYRPFLLGSAGTQSLTHFFSLQTAGKELTGKKVVVIVSPQWFAWNGIQRGMFSYYYSNLQTNNFLEKAKANDPMAEYAASRLLQLPSRSSNPTLTEAIIRVKAGVPLTNWQKTYLRLSERLYDHEDSLFSQLFLRDNRGTIAKGEETLPSQYDPWVLDDLATQMGKGETTNNQFGIQNKFYDQRVRPVVGKLKDSQIGFDYDYGPEFSDFQLLLDFFSRHKITPMFVIPPVNDKWAKYTGLSQEMLDLFDRKIQYQLRTQGFNHIEDLIDQGNQPYFMQDTIHLGWRGWLAVDDAVRPFLENQQPTPKYKINKSFYTKTWQKKEPRDIPDMRAGK